MISICYSQGTFIKISISIFSSHHYETTHSTTWKALSTLICAVSLPIPMGERRHLQLLNCEDLPRLSMALLRHVACPFLITYTLDRRLR